MISLLSILVLGLIAILSSVAGYTEDLESVVGSQSNPNSQVQLAPQVMRPHRYFNKAISGEPISNAFTVAVSACAAVVFMDQDIPTLISLVLGSIAGVLFHAYLALVSHMGRIASQCRFKQLLYKDVVRSHISPIACYAFLTTFCIVSTAYLIQFAFKHPFPFPIIALILGISVGSIGSSVGDVYYGAERLFQNYSFGCGINAAHSGDIIRHGASGILSGHDHAWFCSKFGAPATGLAFSGTIVLTSWLTMFLNPEYETGFEYAAIIIGLAFILCLTCFNRAVEVYARRHFGPYRESEKGEAIKT